MDSQENQDVNPGTKNPVETAAAIADEVTTEGLVNLAIIVDDIFKDHVRRKIDIGVTGQSGSGKSTLINTLRSLTPRDEGAARVGTSETTIKVVPYEFPGNDQLTLWDLPGVNTPKFPRESYVEKVVLERFDCLLIVSASRFTEIDSWLGKEAKMRGIPFYFIRTKVDQDVESAKRDYDTPGEETVEGIRRNTTKNLKKANIKPDVLYLVGCKSLDGQIMLDFPKLVEKLINDAPPKNTEVMVESMMVCSTNILQMKKDELAHNIPNIAAIAADKFRDRKHEEVISETITIYKKWFCIDEEHLTRFNVRMGEMMGSIADKYESLRLAAEKRPPIHRKPGTKEKMRVFFARFGKKKSEQAISCPEVEINLNSDDELKLAVRTEAKEILSDFLDECVQVTQAVIEQRCHMAEI